MLFSNILSIYATLTFAALASAAPVTNAPTVPGVPATPATPGVRQVPITSLSIIIDQATADIKPLANQLSVCSSALLVKPY
jgi:hypothetical protein